MARKPDDIFIIGAESPGGEEAAPQEQSAPRNAFAAAPEEEHRVRPARRGRLRRPPALACLAAALVGLGVVAIARLGGGAERSPGPAPIAAPPRVASTERARRPLRAKARPARPHPHKAASAPRHPRSRTRRRRSRRVAESAEPQAGAVALSPPPAAGPPPEAAPSEEAPPAASPPPADPAPPPRPEFSFER
ncbi:MAG TPA: hypothetical protein VFI09_09830 [Solirubrobacterales bacterium]|nr:hypothetical protein [Solirubrobacterales bacterium]